MALDKNWTTQMVVLPPTKSQAAKPKPRRAKKFICANFQIKTALFTTTAANPTKTAAQPSAGSRLHDPSALPSAPWSRHCAGRCFGFFDHTTSVHQPGQATRQAIRTSASIGFYQVNGVFKNHISFAVQRSQHIDLTIRILSKSQYEGKLFIWGHILHADLG